MHITLFETKLMHKVLIVIGDATETLDTMYPYYRLQEAGFQPVVTAPEKRLYQMVLHEVKPGWTITKEWEGYTLQSDVAFRDVIPEDYIGILFSGGVHRSTSATTKISSASLGISSAKRSRWPVYVTVLRFPAYADCVRGRRMATVAKCRFDLEVCGGLFVDEPCVIDGNLVSGRTFHDNGHYVGPWISLLQTYVQQRGD
jgi:protease I